jgi:hypothetical protein
VRQQQAEVSQISGDGVGGTVSFQGEESLEAGQGFPERLG